MAPSPNNKERFIEKRLNSLHDIDSKVVSLLDTMSQVFAQYANANTNYPQTKQSITNLTQQIYQTISDIAINLRKEVKVMDENIGIYDQNEDSIMILPIPVDQKNTALGKRRLQEELQELQGLLPEEPTDEQKGIVPDNTTRSALPQNKSSKVSPNDAMAIDDIQVKPEPKDSVKLEQTQHDDGIKPADDDVIVVD